MKRLLAVLPIAVVLMASGCSSSPVGTDKSTVAMDQKAVNEDRAIVAKLGPATVLCDAASGCPSATSVPPSTQLLMAQQRLAADEYRLEAAQKKLAMDEAG